MLHTLMNSPFQCDFDLMLRMLKTGDELLMLQNGVLAAIEGSGALTSLLAAPVTLYVLQEDVDARGLSAQISTKVKLVSYNDFVALAVKHPQQMTW
ncbi:sulfurtransferase complex subunit TusB [Winslowiella toletana]|uniref:sulfurtransferase complex subunit TusB n=1 Tax=Winslowiella toletana TaxID=92490 RepID=UPI0028BEC88D|nr:sulfurtransferase complex subunit TusB [Winslowiella toletana]WNN44697.1 sulfurtransferase complex subunit TusB [Winslowiella toletana]